MSSTRNGDDGTRTEWDEGADERTQVIESATPAGWADPDTTRLQPVQAPGAVPPRPDYATPAPTHERDIARPDPRGTLDWDLQVARMHNRPLTDVGLLVLRLFSLPLMLQGIYHVGEFGALVDDLRGVLPGQMASEAVAVGVILGQLLLPPLVGVGFLTRLAALAQAVLMAGLYGLLVLPTSQVLDPATGALSGEGVLAYAAVALPLFFTGAGRFSIDHTVGARGRDRRVEKRVTKRLGG